MSDFKIIPFTIFIFFCYLLGHVISAFSSFFIERLFVKALIGFPSAILLSNDKPRFKLFFGNYRRPLHSRMKLELKRLVDSVFEYEVETEDYYWLCYSYIITSRPYLAPRVHHFVNLFGFSRNITASIIIYLSIRLFFLSCYLDSKMDFFASFSWWLLFSLGFFIFWNYTKLFKRQAIDIYYLFISINKDKSEIKSKSIIED
jgi:hypothetical protein